MDFGPVRNLSIIILDGSFSAVSKPIFAIKYSFCCINFFEIYKIVTPLDLSKLKIVAKIRETFLQIFNVFGFLPEKSHFF